MNQKPLVIGLAGLGTVGGGTADLLKSNGEWIASRVGREIKLKTIVDRDTSKTAQAASYGATLSTSLDDLIRDPEIEVVVELIGGTTVARDLLTRALEAGKHVVTANKALLAHHGDELFPLAAGKGLHLGFEASVAGGIPVIQTIKETLVANRVESLMGILNGTANFILTEMSEKGLPFDVALKDAQAKGFAEADPTLDIEGVDAAHKLVLLIQLCFGQYIPLDKLPIWGVSVVKTMDIQFAKEFGYQIKLIGQARAVNGRIEAGIFPALIPDHYILAQVKGSFNAVRLMGNAGPIMLYGHGAGDLPTGSAVISDIAAIARGAKPNNLGFTSVKLPEADILDLDDAVSRHYLRLSVEDRPGMLRDLGTIMSDNSISLCQVIQKTHEDCDDPGVPLVFLTHEAKARDVHNAMRQIEAQGLNQSKIMHYRIL